MLPGQLFPQSTYIIVAVLPFRSPTAFSACRAFENKTSLKVGEIIPYL